MENETGATIEQIKTQILEQLEEQGFVKLKEIVEILFSSQPTVDDKEQQDTYDIYTLNDDLYKVKVGVNKSDELNDAQSLFFVQIDSTNYTHNLSLEQNSDGVMTSTWKTCGKYYGDKLIIVLCGGENEGKVVVSSTRDKYNRKKTSIFNSIKQQFRHEYVGFFQNLLNTLTFKIDRDMHGWKSKIEDEEYLKVIRNNLTEIILTIGLTVEY